MERRFEPVLGDALVPLPPFRLGARRVEILVPGDHPMWVVVPAYDEAPGIGDALDALAAQEDREFVLCVVDNGSRDATVDVVRQWSRGHPDIACRLVHEPEKGVGAASDTGIRLAIASGASLIARSDADSIPTPVWTREMRASIVGGLDLVIGRPVPRHDQAPLRRGEETLIEVLGAAASLVGRWRPSNLGRQYLAPFQLCTGGNLAIRAETYLAAGGFPRSRMEEVHEDRALMNRVRRVTPQIGLNRRAVNPTSIRRLRAYGFVGILRWYLDHGGRVGPVDVR
jgi:cellulose synthase/poly-beta-1,6-N-acetylglucosamine synthase-like glycosyltransferase